MLHRALWLVGGAAVVVAGIALVLFFLPGSADAPRSAVGDPLETCPRLQLDAGRCDATIEQAIKQAAVARSDIDRVELGRPDGWKIGLGGYLVAIVRLHMVNGPAIDQEVWCIGVGDGHRGWCNDRAPT
jgi:hypothetical protein